MKYIFEEMGALFLGMVMLVVLLFFVLCLIPMLINIGLTSWRELKCEIIQERHWNWLEERCMNY